MFKLIRRNRPVPPVTLNKDLDLMPAECKCKPTDQSPCGPASGCINFSMDIECDKNCPAGDLCTNQNFRKRKTIKLKTFQTPDRGIGLMSVEDVPDETFIAEYLGELINGREAMRRINEQLNDNRKNSYLMQLDGDRYLDSEHCGNSSRFLNHSCKPNCITRKVAVDGVTRIGVYSDQAIKAVSSRLINPSEGIIFLVPSDDRADYRLPSQVTRRFQDGLLMRLIAMPWLD